MRTSMGLAAVALCLGAGSAAMAAGSIFNMFAAPSNGVNYNGFATPSNGVNYNGFGGSPVTPPSGASQATFPGPGQSLAGPGRLIDLLPSLGRISNSHVIGYSLFPSDTNQYLAQFGYQRLR